MKTEELWYEHISVFLENSNEKVKRDDDKSK